MRLLVTGAAGFIGSCFVHLVLAEREDIELINLDAMTYAGNPDNIADVLHHPRHRFVHGSITDRAVVRECMNNADAVVHIAAESHVDRSIASADAFVQTNVVGTQILLDVARECHIRRFVHVSTDEVYGSLGESGQFTESSPLAPNSPYSASKAASDLLVRAAFHTHHMPVMITRCTNNYGPRQFPEKLIPLVIGNALSGQPIPVYGTGANVRNWIHVEDHCRGILRVLEAGGPGEVYNLGSDDELTNLELIRRLLSIIGADGSLIRFVTDRPGHDFRYSLNSSRSRKLLNWSPRIPLDRGLTDTVAWYKANQAWLERVRTGEYRQYYATQYSSRLAQ